MSYDYGAKGKADALAGVRDERLYGLMEPHGEAYRNAHRLARRGALAPALNDGSGFEHAGQTPPAESLPVSASTPSDEPPWAAEAPPIAKDGAQQAATGELATSNERPKSNIGEKSPPLRDDISGLDEMSLGENPPKAKRAPKPQVPADGQIELF